MCVLGSTVGIGKHLCSVDRWLSAIGRFLRRVIVVIQGLAGVLLRHILALLPDNLRAPGPDPSQPHLIATFWSETEQQMGEFWGVM